MNDITRLFSGSRALYGVERWELFQRSHVIVVGLGGVGSWAAEGLVRSGIGAITLCDLDEICTTNTNRQLHTTTKTIGRSKIQVLKDRFIEINPNLNVHLINDFMERENTPEILSKGNYDFVLDATDQVWSKCNMLHWCFHNKTKIITVGASAGLTSPIGLKVEDLNRCQGDPLLRFCKKSLINKMGLPKNEHRKKWRLPAVYMPKPAHDNLKKNCVNDEKGASHCDGQMGSSVFVTASMGFMASGYILDHLQ